MEVLGTPVAYDEYNLDYDDIDFNLDGNGKISSAQTFSPEKSMIDGVTLDKGQKELVALFGNPSNEGEGGSGYQLEFSLEGYRVVMAIGEDEMGEDTAWRVWLYPPQ